MKLRVTPLIEPFGALTLAVFGDVVVITKADPTESNTGYAQGGIAAALGPDAAFLPKPFTAREVAAQVRLQLDASVTSTA